MLFALNSIGPRENHFPYMILPYQFQNLECMLNSVISPLHQYFFQDGYNTPQEDSTSTRLPNYVFNSAQENLIAQSKVIMFKIV